MRVYMYQYVWSYVIMMYVCMFLCVCVYIPAVHNQSCNVQQLGQKEPKWWHQVSSQTVMLRNTHAQPHVNPHKHLYRKIFQLWPGEGASRHLLRSIGLCQKSSLQVLLNNYCICIKCIANLCFFYFWQIGTAHDQDTIPVAYSTQISHGLSGDNLWQQLPP